MMWRMVLEFVLLATFVCLEMRLVWLEFLNPDSRVPWSFSATTEILKVTDLYSNSFKMCSVLEASWFLYQDIVKFKY